MGRKRRGTKEMSGREKTWRRRSSTKEKKPTVIKKKTPLLPRTTQSCRSVASEKPSLQRRNRGRRCLPPHRGEAVGSQGGCGISIAENDDISATSCNTDNIIPYFLRWPIAIWSATHFTDAEPETTTGATDIRDSSKRTADTAGLNEGRRAQVGESPVCRSVRRSQSL